MKCHVTNVLLFLTIDCQCLTNQAKTNKVSSKAGKWEVELLIIFSCEDLKNTTLILPSQAGISLQAGFQLYAAAYLAPQCWLVCLDSSLKTPFKDLSNFHLYGLPWISVFKVTETADLGILFHKNTAICLQKNTTKIHISSHLM